jgi:hypothetical protein
MRKGWGENSKRKKKGLSNFPNYISTIAPMPGFVNYFSPPPLIEEATLSDFSGIFRRTDLCTRNAILDDGGGCPGSIPFPGRE